MPRSVRNFWVDLNVDGRRTAVGSGPRRKDGGFSEEIYIRDEGCIRRALSISGYAVNEKLIINVHEGEENKLIASITTKR
jgi:hypothetical protein